MKRFLLLLPLLLALFVPAAGAATFSDDVVATATFDADVDAYTADAKLLDAMRDEAAIMCKAKEISKKNCTQLNVMFQETRLAFLAKGDRFKEYRRKPGPQTKKAWLNASKKFGFLFDQFKTMTVKNGVEVTP